MTAQTFKPQCNKCFAICCTALSFERGPQFAHDKAAGQPCHYLASDFRCRIHAQREDMGYDGCEAFDCLGAGQRASAIFAGQNWRRDPAVARRLYASFSILLRLQEMRQALVTAADLELDQALHDERHEHLEQMSALADSDTETAPDVANRALTEAKAFLKRLAPIVNAGGMNA